ncbi:MAG TPA: aminoglycoside phosphotransferase family protein [Microlunatus sp.]
MHVSAELAAAIRAFEIGLPDRPPIPVGQAWSNEVWQIRTVEGAYAIKLFPPLSAPRRQELEAGQRFEKLVLEAGIVPLPRPVASPAGWLVEVRSRTGLRLARCHEWMHGVATATPLGDEVVAAAGRYLGSLHALKQPGGDSSQLATLDRARWDRAVQLARAQDLGWAEGLADLAPLVDDLAVDLDVLRDQRRPMLISHRDYDPKNSLIDTSGRLVITDWDYAGPVLPGVELIVGAASFATTDRQVVAFVESYCAVAGDLPHADPLAMTAEVSDLDWLLRNVDACVRGDLGPGSAQYTTAESLISSLPHDVAIAHSWPRRLADLVTS